MRFAASWRVILTSIVAPFYTCHASVDAARLVTLGGIGRRCTRQRPRSRRSAARDVEGVQGGKEFSAENWQELVRDKGRDTTGEVRATAYFRIKDCAGWRLSVCERSCSRFCPVVSRYDSSKDRWERSCTAYLGNPVAT